MPALLEMKIWYEKIHEIKEKWYTKLIFALYGILIRFYILKKWNI